MSTENIYQIVEKNYNIVNEARKIHEILTQEDFFCYSNGATIVRAINMERWSSGLRHTLGKRARLTASAGSNPVLSAIV